MSHKIAHDNAVRLAQKSANRTGQPRYVTNINGTWRISAIYVHSEPHTVVQPDPAVREVVQELQEDIEKLLMTNKIDKQHSLSTTPNETPYLFGKEQAYQSVLRLFSEDYF